MMYRFAKVVAVAALTSFFLTGCVVEERHPRRTVYVRTQPPAEIVVTEAPPPPPAEVVVECPGPRYVWVPGVWVWSGRWTWERGHWAYPPRPGAVWVPHRYVYRGGVHVWARGGWR